MNSSYFLIAALSILAVSPAEAQYLYRKTAPGLEVTLPASSPAPEPVVPALPPADVSAPLVNLAAPAALTLPANTSPPFTVAGWVNVTSGTGYLFSLGTYRNAQDYGLYHSGLISNGTHLAYGWRYHFNPFYWTEQYPIAPISATWTHVAAEVDTSYRLKVAINGQFVYSKQLASSIYVPYGGNPPQAGGAGAVVGVYSPNGALFTLRGTMENVSVWNELVWKGESFTPPPR